MRTMTCRCAVPDWRETIFDTYICMRCGAITDHVVTAAVSAHTQKEQP